MKVLINYELSNGEIWQRHVEIEDVKPVKIISMIVGNEVYLTKDQLIEIIKSAIENDV